MELHKVMIHLTFGFSSLTGDFSGGKVEQTLQRQQSNIESILNFQPLEADPKLQIPSVISESSFNIVDGEDDERMSLEHCNIESILNSAMSKLIKVCASRTATLNQY